MNAREYLETVFGYRIASDGNIKAYIDKIDRLGRFGDKQQKEIIVFLLSRTIKLEERLSLVEDKTKNSITVSSKELVGEIMGTPTTKNKKVVKTQKVKPQSIHQEVKDLHIAALWKIARERGIAIKGKSRADLIKELQAT